MVVPLNSCQQKYLIGIGDDNLLAIAQDVSTFGDLHVVRIVAVGHIGQRLLVVQIPLAKLPHAGHLVESLEHPVEAVLHALPQEQTSMI